jgi:hypothetical protein
MKNLINKALIWKEFVCNKWIYILGILIGLYPSLKIAGDIVNYNYNMAIFNLLKDIILNPLFLSIIRSSSNLRGEIVIILKGSSLML